MTAILTQHPMPQPLEPLRFPLAGRSLIEASAGTGKTFTIAMLYVRLVLGHDPERAEGRAPCPLTPPEILVVTFTDAATKELRDRIRVRLTEAARYFQADPDQVKPLPAGKQDLLHALRDAYPPQQWPTCARRLKLAAESMDEAAVSTIHGWCNRMLREHAFDSDSLFEQSLETDQSELLAQVVRDYWRTFMAPLNAAQAAAVATWATGPEKLQKELRNLIDVSALLPDAKTPAEELDARPQRMADFKKPWQTWPALMIQLIDDACKEKIYPGGKYNSKRCGDWLRALSAWANDPDAIAPKLSDTAWKRFSRKELDEHCAPGKTPLSHEAFDALAMLRKDVEAIQSCRGRILAHAARWIAGRFAEEQASRSQIGFDDLLKRLDTALASSNGERLAQVIRAQFPVALVDEFQDTDPTQYRIFDKVYDANVAVATSDDTQRVRHALIMIGDPKQAIYAFRGADIYTYLKARRACGTRLFTLAKNFRSTHAMVDAVNHCFNVAEKKPGGGAFLFRDKEDDPVPFVSVSAQDRSDAFVVDGENRRALTVWHLPPEADDKPLGKGAYLEQMAASCATEMVRLLGLGQRNAAGFDGEAGRRALRPADMAVLVNNRDEAKAIRTALGERGVRSVYLSDKDSVYMSEQAAEMTQWLAACAEPEDGRLVRNALATATIGFSFSELDALFSDETRWENCMLQFRGYRDCWRDQGVLPMVRRFLNDFGVSARLLGFDASAPRANVDGERVLTDLLHLAELLQHASTLIEGEQGLIRHLVEERDAASEGSGGDARQIRLESDGDLVKVITIHKSKGLEYPLVFLPFICAHRPVELKDTLIRWHDEHGELCVALEQAAKMFGRADDERLGEDLRKLYVALTRARYATWIGVAPLKALERSAIGYLLSGRDALVPGELMDALRKSFVESEQIAVLPAPKPGAARYVPRNGPSLEGTARRFDGRVVREPWWIASYSSLRMTGGAHSAEPQTRGQDLMNEMRNAQDKGEDTERGQDNHRAGSLTPATAQSAGNALHEFPRGPQQGSFLHDLLEWAAQQGFGETAAHPARLREVIARRCALRGWERWIDPLNEWILGTIRTPFVLKDAHGMHATSFALSKLETAIGEMEFWFAADRVGTTELDRIVRVHTFDAAARPALEYAQLNGMLKGFMDLVFEHDGRYYVADYKSNWLGADDAHYSTERIREQMLRSRYDLQMVLYLLALHRLLKARVPNYDYDAHIGGAVYLFIRGLNAPSQGVCAERPPRELIDRLDALFTGEANVFAAGLEIE